SGRGKSRNGPTGPATRRQRRRRRGSRLRGPGAERINADGQRQRHGGEDLSYAIRRLCPGDLETLRALNALFGEVFDERETYAGDPPSDEDCRDLLGRADLLLGGAVHDGRRIGGAVGR